MSNIKIALSLDEVQDDKKAAALESHKISDEIVGRFDEDQALTILMNAIVQIALKWGVPPDIFRVRLNDFADAYGQIYDIKSGGSRT